MPERAEPVYNLGLVYDAVEQPDRAISYFEQAFAPSWDEPKIIGASARARVKRGDRYEETRHLVREIIFRYKRPNWTAWAREVLNMKLLAKKENEVE